jgi:fermentation-respiration switch protein FrsA (DUF1100 family)
MTGNTILRVVMIAAILYLGLNLFALLFSERMIFAPRTPSYTELPRELKIVSGSEKINAVFLEHPEAAYTILFSHGNAEDLGGVLPFMQQFYERGYSVLMYDYRGYGTSEGRPSVRNTYEDVDAAYQWLIRKKGVAPETIIAQGRSVGGGPAAWLAANRTVCGLVLESTFVSAFRVRTVIPLLPWDKFNNLKHIRRTDCPVLIIHGREDSVLPFWHGRKLYEAAPGKKMHLWINNAEHNDYAYVAGDAYFDAFERFVDELP